MALCEHAPVATLTGSSTIDALAVDSKESTSPVADVEPARPTIEELRATEPLLDPKSNRFVLFPIKHDDIWQRYKVAEASIWHAAEIDMSLDVSDWKHKLNDDERHFITYVLAFFASSDMIVINNFLDRFISEVQYPELKIIYTYFSFQESIHVETYALMIDTFVDPHEKEKVFNAIQTIPIIKKKADWAIKWLSGDDAFVERLLGFVAVEGICFCSSFCAIYWLMKRNLMTESLGKSNEFIARDELMHANLGILLYRNHIVNKLPESRVHAIIGDAVDLEMEFACESLPVRLIGMNCESMQQYIKYVADGILRELGVSELYHVTNPYDWMENLQLESKSSFFETRVSQYIKAGVMDSEEERKFSLDADF